MPEPTKADLKAAVAKLTEEKAVLAAENAALYGLFAAIRHGSEGHGELPWIIGYAGSIGNDDHVGRNVRTLRAHARNLRRGPGCHAEHDGHYCDLRAGHAPARHEVHGDDGELIAAWDDETEPVITDSDRTCDQAKPVRYEVRAEPEPAATVPAPNPPHHAFRTDERECTAQGYEDADSGYICTSQEGHDGPDHVAWNPGGGEYHRWPIADPAPMARVTDDGQTYSDGPASVTA